VNSINRRSIAEALHRISPYVRCTPTIEVPGSDFGCNGTLVFKLEQLQVTGSFKARGAFNRTLSNTVPQCGLIAASGGNHGIAVAYVAKQLGHPAEIFVHANTSPVKKAAIEALGAKVFVVGTCFDDAFEASTARQRASGALMITAFHTEETLAGQGSLACEWESQSRRMDTVLVATGGAGLIAGISAWFEKSTQVLAVEPIAAPTLHHALAAGIPTRVDVGGVAGDSMGARQVSDIAFSTARQWVQRSLLVSDKDIIEAQRRLWQDLRLIVEPGGAVALAALLSGSYQPSREERVGVLLCGANTDDFSFTTPLNN